MQNILALTIVLAAVAYLGWRAWALVSARRASSCGSACSGCTANAKGANLVSLELPAKQASAPNGQKT